MLTRVRRNYSLKQFGLVTEAQEALYDFLAIIADVKNKLSCIFRLHYALSGNERYCSKTVSRGGNKLAVL